MIYKPSLSEVAEYMKAVIESYRDKVDSSLPSVSLCGYKDYERNRVEKENNGGRFILIGDSVIATKFIKNINNNEFDFDKYGIRYAVNESKSLIIASPPKNS